MKILRIIFYLNIILFFSCNKTEKENNYDKIEQNVLLEIIPQIINEYCLQIPPPPPPPKSNIEIKKYERNKFEYQILIDSLKNSEKFIAISDTLYSLEKLDYDKFNKNWNKSYLKGIKINLNSINVAKNLKILTSNEIRSDLIRAREDGKNWNEYNSLKKLTCVMSFSRLVFNEKKDHALFRFGVSCGKHCGSGFEVIIKKVKEKWIIKNVKSTWVS